MKKLSVLFLIAIIFITGCQPSETAVQTAIAQTQVALPTAMQIPTDTPLPPTPTSTATIVPSPTPDIRLIDIDPRNLLLQTNDLPIEGKYYLPGEGWTSPVLNSEIISSWTVEKGQSYLAETGRIDGWYVSYKRGRSGVLMPEEFYDNVVIYSKIEGAQIVVTKYGDRYITDDNFKEIDAPQVGDITRAFKMSKTNSSGETRVWIKVTFSYRNVFHDITVWGWEKEVSLDYAVSVATKLLESLRQLPLSTTVTFTP